MGWKIEVNEKELVRDITEKEFVDIRMKDVSEKMALIGINSLQSSFYYALTGRSWN